MPSHASRRQCDGEPRVSFVRSMKLWDGHRRTAVEWNGPHREPALWATNGNCLVHLHAKGESNQGASFRVSFKALIQSRCYAFIDRYIDKQGRKLDMPKTDADWNRLCPKRTVSLYVPLATGSTRAEMARQQLGVRNLLAWVMGIPLAGDHLGGEIVTLFRNMINNRPSDADCERDLLAYLDYIGYTDIVAQPHYALAMLYTAEHLRQEDLYTRAFVHCVGMRERIYSSTEYTKISLVSRKLIRSSSHQLESKLENAIEDLGSFLDEELSESRLGLPHGVRTHLDRFRSALFTFYTAKFGYYPPRDFDAQVVETMLEDFEALYDLLVDDGAGTPGMVGGNNGGGLCILQTIRMFDSWNSFESRRHPLPLLPTASEVRKTRRMPWFSRGDKDKQGSRLVAHTALIKASNWHESLFKNELVRTYREFEGKSLLPPPNKTEKADKVSITDARKVRWILIYAICQVLRSVSQRAPQVEGERAPYFLSASVAELPPWSTALNTALPMPSTATMRTTSAADEPWQPKFVDGLEIKPDVDYFALTHNVDRRQQPERLGRRQSMPVVQDAVSPHTSSPTNSVSRKVLVRRSTIRNSISRRLRPGTATSTPAATAPAKSPYHEIVVHGYGNGTNEVRLERRNTIGCDRSEEAPVGRWSTPDAPPTAFKMGCAASVSSGVESSPSLSTAVTKQSRSSSNRSSNASTIGMTDASGPASPATIATPEFEQHGMEPAIVRNSSHRSLTQRHPVKSVLDTLSRTSSMRRGSLVSSASGGGKEPAPPALPARAPSLRKSLLPESWNLSGRTVESDIDEEDEMVTLQAEADEWFAMQAFLDDNGPTQLAHKGAATPGWEQYNDLGGLTEIQ